MCSPSITCEDDIQWSVLLKEPVFITDATFVSFDVSKSNRLHYGLYQICIIDLNDHLISFARSHLTQVNDMRATSSTVLCS